MKMRPNYKVTKCEDAVKRVDLHAGVRVDVGMITT